MIFTETHPHTRNIHSVRVSVCFIQYLNKTAVCVYFWLVNNRVKYLFCAFIYIYIVCIDKICVRVEISGLEYLQTDGICARMCPCPSNIWIIDYFHSFNQIDCKSRRWFLPSDLPFYRFSRCSITYTIKSLKGNILDWHFSMRLICHFRAFSMWSFWAGRFSQLEKSMRNRLSPLFIERSPTHTHSKWKTAL